MLERLSLNGFRNLEALDWSVAPGSHLLIGGNGAGKTSLLEAIYLAATTRSFRTAQIRDCARAVKADPALEIAEVPDAGVDFSVRLEVAEPFRARLRLWLAQGIVQRELNDRRVGLREYLEPLPVVVWSSRETEVLSGSLELRRLMVDRGVAGSDLRRLEELSSYRRCLTQKRELLRRGLGGLESWNSLLAIAAADLARLRAAHIEALQKHLDDCVLESGLSFPSLRLVYRPSPARALRGVDAIEAALVEATPEERRRRRPLVGPHRDKIRFLWGDSDVSQVASAGERKAFGLLLLAAQARTLEAAGRPPVVLADDIDTELDLNTFSAVWRVLSGCRQILVTSNREAAWESLSVSGRWSVMGGRIES